MCTVEKLSFVLPDCCVVVVISLEMYFFPKTALVITARKRSLRRLRFQKCWGGGGGSVKGVSVQGRLSPGGLCPGVSVQGSLFRGLCSGGFLSGGSLSRGVSVRETPLYGYMRTERILLECILVLGCIFTLYVKMKIMLSLSDF